MATAAIVGFELTVLPPDPEARCLAFVVGGDVFVVDQGSPDLNQMLARLAAQQTLQNRA